MHSKNFFLFSFPLCLSDFYPIFFSESCDRLGGGFSELCWPNKLTNHITLSGTNCLSCLDPFMLYPDCSVAQCYAGTVYNSVTSSCEPCSYSCLTCIDSATRCTMCPLEARRLDLAPVNYTCPCEDQFRDVGYQICCPGSCLSCHQNGTCASCEAYKLINYTSNQCECARYPPEPYRAQGICSSCLNGFPRV